jgi:hypothetical protein
MHANLQSRRPGSEGDDDTVLTIVRIGARLKELCRFRAENGYIANRFFFRILAKTILKSKELRRANISPSVTQIGTDV